jgi:Ankyrin repeats (many copies)
MLYDKLTFNKQSVYFDLLNQTDQFQLIDQYIQAAREGIKELNNNDVSQDTIVRETVHLHKDALFRIIFQQGCPILDTANTEGNSLLLNAVAANDEALVAEILKCDGQALINHPNKKGITPLLAAIDVGNPKLVKLLLKHGAAPSIHLPDTQTSPLHMAATLKNPVFLKILLKFKEAKAALMMKDFRGLTPLQRAIISGRVSAVKMMLEAYPELAATLNQPNEFGITDIHRAARSGNMEMMRLLLPLLKNEKIKLDERAFFTEEELHDCLAVQSKDFIETIPIDDVAFPLTIAQNSCNTMIGLKNGKILKIPNADAVQVRGALLDRKFGTGAADRAGLNILTLYMNPGHGYLRLECRNCDEGKPYNMNRGFWGAGRKLAIEQTEAPQQKTDHHKIEPEPISSQVIEFISTHRNSVIAALVAPFAASKMRHYPRLTAGALSMKFFPLEFTMGLLSSAMPSAFDLSNRLKGVFNSLTLGTYTGNLKTHVARGLRENIHIGYMLTKEQVGEVGNEDMYESISDVNNSLKIMFYVDDAQATAAMKTVKKAMDSCKNNPSEACRYQFLQHNCIEFLQDVYQSTGGAGNFGSFLTDQQLSHGHLNSVRYVNRFRAHNYAFVRSRGMEHYLKYGLGWKVDSQFQSLPSREVQRLHLTDHSEECEAAPQYSMSAPSYPWQLVDDVMLGAVLIKAAVNTYHFVSNLWVKMVGEKVLEEDFLAWQTQQAKVLKTVMDQLKAFGSTIDSDLIEIDCMQEENVKQERSILGKFWNDYIDLLFDGFKLEEEFDALKSSRSLPTKAYLADLNKKIASLVAQADALYEAYVIRYS